MLRTLLRRSRKASSARDVRLFKTDTYIQVTGLELAWTLIECFDSEKYVSRLTVDSPFSRVGDDSVPDDGDNFD
jgi:hypothetical protein